MKWCLACKIDYENYVEKCKDCGALLISETEYYQQIKPKHPEYNPEALNLAVVYETTLESEVLHVCDLLKENGIHSEIKNNGIGSYLQIYSGVNYLGTSICVKEEDAEAAKALIENLWGESNPEVQLDVDSNMVSDDETTDMEDYRREYNKSLNLKRNFLKLFLLLIFGSVIVIQIISVLY